MHVGVAQPRRLARPSKTPEPAIAGDIGAVFAVLRGKLNSSPKALSPVAPLEAGPGSEVGWCRRAARRVTPTCDHGKAIKIQRLIIRKLSNDLPDQAEIGNRTAFHAGSREACFGQIG